MDFELIGKIENIEPIAIGHGIRVIPRLRKIYGLCINNEGYAASLEVGKLYQILPDDDAASHGYIRVIDESGEDYGYSNDRFFPIKIPEALERTLLKAA